MKTGLTYGPMELVDGQIRRPMYRYGMHIGWDVEISFRSFGPWKRTNPLDEFPRTRDIYLEENIIGEETQESCVEVEISHDLYKELLGDRDKCHEN